MSVCVINHVISRLKNINLHTKNLSKYDFPLKIEQEIKVYIFFSHNVCEKISYEKYTLKVFHSSDTHSKYIEICSLAYTFFLAFTTFVVL